MGVLRYLFVPEFGRAVANAGAATGRIVMLFGMLCAGAGGKPRLSRLLPPAARWRSVVGLLLVVGGGVAVLSAVGGAVGADARAQVIDPGLFAAEDDATRKILGFLSDFDAAGSPVLGRMLFVFNGGVLVLAGYLLVWHTVTGSVETAREGRWGFGAWEVIRIVTAVALMAPLPGGMNGAQHVVVSLAKLGGDFAHAVWEPFASDVLGKGRAIVPWPREDAWRETIARTLVAEVCFSVANSAASAAGDAPYVAVREVIERPPVHTRGPLRPEKARTRSYDGTGNAMPKAMCGSVRFAGLAEKGGRGIAARGHRRAWGAVHPTVVRLGRELGEHYVAGSGRYGGALPNVTQELDGFGVADTYRAILEIDLKAAGEQEHRTLQAEVEADAANISWLAAASFVTTMASSAGRIQAAAHNVPKVSLPAPSLDKWAPAADAAVKGIVAALAQDGAYEALRLSSAAGAAGAVAASSGRGGDVLDRVMEFIDPETVVIIDSVNPLMDIASTGHGLIASALSVMGALAAASVGNNFVEVLPFIGKGLDVFEAGWAVADGFVTPVISIVLIAGAVLAYFVPAMPFILFLFGVLAWLLAVVEAVLSVTVFAAAHVTRGEGNKLAVEASRYGWLFLPGLILRPALMLFGLIIGYFVFVAMVGLFNEIWVPRLRAVSATGGLGPIDFIAMLAVYVIVVYGLVNASFKLIEILPNAVLEWVGGRASVGDGGERVGGMVTGGMGRVGGLRVGGGARGLLRRRAGTG